MAINREDANSLLSLLGKRIREFELDDPALMDAVKSAKFNGRDEAVILPGELDYLPVVKVMFALALGTEECSAPTP